MNLSENLKRIRKENNLSQEQLAEKLGVSRQSVSKWESGQAYPEMDKMLQLCEMFNLNMDDLLNQNINEVNSKKKSKINVNKYIDNFLDFITKTTKMFGAMTFKEKVKCVFEQIFLIILFIIVASIVGLVLSSIVEGLTSFLPSRMYYYFDRIWHAILMAGFVVIGAVIILHIFKIRYLNYYEVVHEDEEATEEKTEIEETKTEDVKIIVEPKEKVIIRDPKHSEYGFIKGLVNIAIFIIKLFAVFVGMMFIGSLIGLATALVLSFTIVKSGTLFIGIFIGLIAAITINIIFLIIIYNFVLDNEIKGKVLGLTFLISLLLVGTGIGLTIHGASNIEEINIRKDKNNEYYTVDTYEYEYDGSIIWLKSSNNEFHEVEGNTIKLVLTHYKDYEYKFEKNEETNMIYYISQKDTSELKDIKQILKDINTKKLIDYADLKLDIYASKENIEKLKLTY